MRQLIWKFRLENWGHFVPASVSYLFHPNSTMLITSPHFRLRIGWRLWLQPIRRQVENLCYLTWILTLKFYSITVASYRARWRLELPGAHLFAQPFIQVQINVNIKDPHHWPLWGGSNGERWIPSQKASNAENIPIWWPHHGIPGPSLFQLTLPSVKDRNINDMCMSCWKPTVPARTDILYSYNTIQYQK